MSDDLQDEAQLGGDQQTGQLYQFEHAGARFISGLFWQVLSKPREALQEAKELGESMNFDYMTMRNAGAVMQAGFAAKNDGAIDNMVSMAALLSRAIEAAETADAPQNWLAAVLLPSGDFAYAAVRDGAFLPDGDVAGPKEDIINRLTGDYGLGEWDLVIAPEDFGFPGSVERRFEEFLPLDKKGRFKPVSTLVVQPVRKHLPWKMISIVVGAVATLGILGNVALGYLETKAAQDRENAMRMEEARLAEEQRQKALATPPWATVADSMDVLQKCEQAIFEVPFSPVGWAISDLICAREGSLIATYQRGPEGAPTFDLKREIGNKSRIDWSGEKATVQQKLEFKMGGRESLWFADEAVYELVGRFQQLGAKLTVREDITGVGPLAQRPTAAIKYKVLGFTVATNIKPSAYGSALAVPGVRVKSVKVTPTGEWTTEGEIYVEPPK